MDVELKPCPFCGSSNVRLLQAQPGTWWVQCVDCRASSDDRAKHSAIEIWNRRDESHTRAAVEAERAAVERDIEAAIRDFADKRGQHWRGEQASELEKVARVLHRQDPIAEHLSWEQLDAADRDEFLREAAEIIAAIDEARGWRPIESLSADDGQVLGYTEGCGYDVIRKTGNQVYAGAFNADWVKLWQPLPAPPKEG